MFLWSNIIPSVTLSSIQLSGKKRLESTKHKSACILRILLCFYLVAVIFFVAPLAAISYQTSVHGVTVNSYGSYLFVVFVSS